MKITTLSNIMLLASLLLLSPLVENPFEETLIQNTAKSIAIEIHQPEIKITSSIAGTVVFNVTYFRTSNNNTNVILTNAKLDLSTREIIIKAKEPGYYIFDLISTDIGKISIKAQGIYQTSWIIILIFLIFRLLIWTKNRYF